MSWYLIVLFIYIATGLFFGLIFATFGSSGYSTQIKVMIVLICIIIGFPVFIVGSIDLILKKVLD